MICTEKADACIDARTVIKEENGNLDCNGILDCHWMCRRSTLVITVYGQKLADIYAALWSIHRIGAGFICRSVFLV